MNKWISHNDDHLCECGLCKALEICLSPGDFRGKQHQDEPIEGRIGEECKKTKKKLRNWNSIGKEADEK